jgi:hypothetical protein
MVRSGEVNYFKCEGLGAVVTGLFEGDRQDDPSEGDELLAQNHSVEWVWATLELVLGEPQSLEGVEAYKVEALLPSIRAFVSQVVPTSRSTMRGNLPGLGMLSRWSVQSKVIRDLDQHRYSRTTVLMVLIAQPMSLSLSATRGGSRGGPS